MFVIVPDYLDRAIEVLIDKVLPADGQDSRNDFRSAFLDHFDKHGSLPNIDQIKVQKN